MEGIKKTQQMIQRAREIAVVCHINPDGDCIGSLLALGLGLEGIGKKIYMVSQDGVPRRYKFLPGADRIVKRLDKKVDLAIAVDCGVKELLGRSFKIFKNARRTIEIDHHQIREPFADVQMVDPRAAAVGEQIYPLLKGLKASIDRDITQNILTSLIVETSSFRLPTVRPYTFELCRKLAATGVDFYALADNVFWANTREVAVLSGICLARCKFISRNKIAWSIIRKRDFKSVKGKDEDVDAVADDMRAIKGVHIAVLFREKRKKTLRVSLRSKYGINVARIAKMYGGGGHADVAGCTIPDTPYAIKGLLGRLEDLIS